MANSVQADHTAVAQALHTVAANPALAPVPAAAPQWMQPILAQLNRIEGKIDALVIKNIVSDEISMARAHNSSPGNYESKLVGLPVRPLLEDGAQAQPGPAPAGFPLTRGDALNLNGQEVHALLLAYHLPTHGTVAERRERLMFFIGCRL